MSGGAVPRTSRISPQRVLAEGAVIVIYILLAFGIDAGWEGSRDRQDERALPAPVADDVGPEACVGGEDAVVAMAMGAGRGINRESRRRGIAHSGVHLGPILGLFTPADSGIDVGQERQIVRSTSELDVFLP